MPFYVPQYLDIVNEQELLTVIQEAQFNNPKLKQLESLIGRLRKENKYSEYRSNTSSIIIEISKLLEDIFGFNSCQFSVDQSKFPNAYTAPISSKVDAWNYKKCVKVTNQGMQFTPVAKVNTAVHITTELLYNEKFTNGEIVAILLHEIGHNFSDSINNTLGVFTNFKKVLLIPSLLTSPQHVSNIVRKTATDYNNYMRKNHPELVDCFNAFNMFFGVYQYVQVSVNKVLAAIPGYSMTALINSLNAYIQQIAVNPINFVLNIIFSFFGKEDEYTSDSFVAMYGYGPELSSALTKLSRHNLTPIDTVFKDSKFGAMYYALMVESVEFILGLLRSTHPSDAKRLLNILNTLEQELDQDYINPKFKKETEKEIAEIKKLINQELNNKSFDGNYWRIAWNKHVLVNKKDKGPKDKMIGEVLDKIGELYTKG